MAKCYYDKLNDDAAAVTAAAAAAANDDDDDDDDETTQYSLLLLPKEGNYVLVPVCLPVCFCSSARNRFSGPIYRWRHFDFRQPM